MEHMYMNSGCIDIDSTVFGDRVNWMTVIGDCAVSCLCIHQTKTLAINNKILLLIKNDIVTIKCECTLKEILLPIIL